MNNTQTPNTPFPSFHQAPPPVLNLKCINPKCFAIPEITFLPPNNISLLCKCTPSPQTLPLQSYLSKLNTIKIEQCQFDISHISPTIPALNYCMNCEMWLCSECVLFHKTKLGLSKHKITNGAVNSIYCDIHPSQEIRSYCLICKVHYCMHCIPLHNGHVTKKLERIITEDVYSNIINEYKNTKVKFYDEIKRAKDVVIQEYENRIKEVNQAYENCIRVNNTIIEFIDLLIQNYEENKKNYNMILNLLNNTHFSNNDDINFKINLSLFNKQQHNNIIKYFSNAFIIKNINQCQSSQTTDNNNNNNSNNNNLLHQPIKILQTIDNCNEAITLLPNNKIATGTAQCSIKIFTLTKTSSTCDLTIPKAHSNQITYLSYFNDKLFSCSYDNKIKIWYIYTLPSEALQYSLVIEITAHSKWINKIIPLTKSRFATCSNDKSVKIWNSEYPYDFIHKFDKHTDDVNSIIQLRNKEVLVSASSKKDSTFRTWDLNVYSEIYAIKKVQCSYYNGLLELNSGIVVVGGFEVIYMVNVIKKEVIKCIEHKMFKDICIDSLLEVGKCLVCGCEKGKVVFVNVDNGEVKGEYVHKEDVSGLVVMNWNETKGSNSNSSNKKGNVNDVIVSSSFDGTVKVWECL